MTAAFLDTRTPVDAQPRTVRVRAVENELNGELGALLTLTHRNGRGRQRAAAAFEDLDGVIHSDLSLYDEDMRILKDFIPNLAKLPDLPYLRVNLAVLTVMTGAGRRIQAIHTDGAWYTVREVTK